MLRGRPLAGGPWVMPAGGATPRTPRSGQVRGWSRSVRHSLGLRPVPARPTRLSARLASAGSPGGSRKRNGCGDHRNGYQLQTGACRGLVRADRERGGSGRAGRVGTQTGCGDHRFGEESGRGRLGRPRGLGPLRWAVGPAVVADRGGPGGRPVGTRCQLRSRRVGSWCGCGGHRCGYRPAVRSSRRPVRAGCAGPGGWPSPLAGPSGLLATLRRSAPSPDRSPTFGYPHGVADRPSPATRHPAPRARL